MIEIVGASPTLERAIRAALGSFPAWYVKAARISKIEVSSSPEVRAQKAMFEHGSRVMKIFAGVGSLLVKAVGHELAHGIDDNFGSPHYFTTMSDWVRIHQNQSHFDIDKYRDQALEHFADVVVKVFMIGPRKLATTMPDEVLFVTSTVFPLLMKEFGQ